MDISIPWVLGQHLTGALLFFPLLRFSLFTPEAGAELTWYREMALGEKGREGTAMYALYVCSVLSGMQATCCRRW